MIRKTASVAFRLAALSGSLVSILITQPPIAGQVRTVHALFDLNAPDTGPFPSDWFTVSDANQNTRRRVNLPMPDCTEQLSDCEDLAVINTLDGFHLDPRLSIPFDGPIDVTTVTSANILLIRLDDSRCDRDDNCDDDEHFGHRTVGINQVVWDPVTDTLHVQSNELLDQRARYALVVTRGVRDELGQPVEATEAFRRFRQRLRGDYKRALLDAVRVAHRMDVSEDDIVTASVFTTQSVTSVLEKMRDQIKAANPEPADFGLGPGGSRTVFPLDTVSGITSDQQTGDDPPVFTHITVNSSLLRLIPDAVGTVAFGKYASPDYEVHPGEFIPPIGTRTGTPDVQGANEVYFNLVLPSGPKPDDGWPVAIFGHGNGQDKNLSFNVATVLASQGIATIAINAVGAGFGALGTLTVTQTGGASVTFSAGGRGIDQDGNHVIDANEGFRTAPPRTVLFFTDGIRQTVADLMQLVRVIEAGIDLDGDGAPDLNPSRIYYVGHSLGGNFGTVFMAVEPAVRVGVLTSFGAPIIEGRRLGPGTRAALGQLLASRMPALVNAPGITNLAGVSVGPPQFNENFPLRDAVPLRVLLADGTSQEIQSPVVNMVSGAVAIQHVVEHMKWVGRAGDSVAYAPYLRKAPLVGVPAKSVICQFAKGDQGSANPNETALVRAGDLADQTLFYRHDVAYAENPVLPKNPHPFMVGTDNTAFRPISLAVQAQIASFFATDGQLIIQPQPAQFFEMPIVLPLPEDLSFIP